MSVVLTDLSERILTVTVHRPEKLNALNAAVLEMLDVRLAEAQNETDLRCVIVTGAGDKAFVSGADVGAIRQRRRGKRSWWSFLRRVAAAAIQNGRASLRHLR